MIREQSPHDFNTAALADLQHFRAEVSTGMADVRAAARETIRQAYITLAYANSVLDPVGHFGSLPRVFR